MPTEDWKPIKDFPEYMISDRGRVYNSRTETIMAESKTMQGDHKVTLSSMGERVTRSVRVLVAEAFVPKPPVGPGFHKTAIPDTVIVLDNNQDNIASYNLAWRPRWFAHKYARQFRQEQPEHYYTHPVQNLRSKRLYNNIVEAGIAEGLLFNDIYKSATTGLTVYPANTAFIYP